ncbi:hypothetical protein K503DRAFT_804850 [Rhizopogon vinicolor AM-OR11-026]|uniref:DUF6535 domain-containing protein n=1 Tax=Rhizopogon vinicolor AM-OR11-026 TaxID=1314800 RepID=A0A1B7MJU5_9AGAM|nr:hypothetical protein K503DRAFT_804850 [Rhizopogon vinicolor AM-OR11-026]
MQTLAYASLSLSLLAAFGAVMGKQWLNSYKAARGRGTLQDRGLQRQRKLDGLELWHLKKVLEAFLALLQISLLLFGLSLSAYMFTRQPTISSVVISTTALGILFYVATIFISLLHPDSPFQTIGTALVGAICQKARTITVNMIEKSSFLYRRFRKFTILPDMEDVKARQVVLGRLSAIRWILETSTNPEVAEAAAAVIPRTQWPPEVDATVVYARLVNHLTTCINRPELFMTFGKAMAHLRANSVTIGSCDSSTETATWMSWRDMSSFIREAFADAHRACDRRQKTEQDARAKVEAGARTKDEAGARAKDEADARSALRTIMVHGLGHCLLHPDDENLIWDGDFRWRHSNGNTPSSEEFDWLIDYLVEKVEDETDAETEGDALLALSAMHGLGSSAKRSSYVKALIRCMAPVRPSRVRYAALRAVSDARDELASMTISDSASLDIDATLLDGLSRALLTAVGPNQDQTVQHSTSDADFAAMPNYYYYYLRLIFALQKNDEWWERLAHGGHLERWSSSFLYDITLASPNFLDKTHLAGILLRIDPSSNDVSPNLAQEKWWTLIRRAWNSPHLYFLSTPEHIEALQTLVTMTKQNLPRPNNPVAKAELAKLAKCVDRVLYSLKLIRTFLRLQADAGFDGAVLAVQGLYDDLSSYAASENRHTPQGDDELLEP